MMQRREMETTHGKVATQFGASLSYEARNLHGIHHKELHDLQYVVERAIKECRDELQNHSNTNRLMIPTTEQEASSKPSQNIFGTHLNCPRDR